jgi:Hemopexin
MASSVRISGSLPDPGDGSTKGLVFAGGWGAEYDWGLDHVTASGQPRRLAAIGLPPPFDSDLEGALRGRAAFSAFLYLFKGGRYLRLQAATLTPDGPDAATAPAWGLPADWTSFDAVLPGRGIKIDFAYFFRGPEYVRFDWTTNAVSPGYPKRIGSEWHQPAPFDAAIDGVIVGQAGFTTKAYLFQTLLQSVSNADGAVVGAGTPDSTAVRTPGYSRYDYTAEAGEGTATGPLNVVPPWNGLFPVLDAGPAVDTALQWCDAALSALANPATPALTTALTHHFMTAAPSASQLAEITNRMASVRNRIAQIPDKFQWTARLSFAAQTTPGTLTEIGDPFSILHGPNGRAAVLIHEAVHFVFVAGGVVIDVPEWSGATINGVTFGIAGGMAYSAMTPDQAIANPSSYAAFAQEIFFGTDTRFGEARHHE